jgi:hypothetical protein
MRSRGNSTSSYAPANWTSRPPKREIASNWIEAYKKYVSESSPASSGSETKSPPANAPPNEVWVNTRSGKFAKSIAWFSSRCGDQKLHPGVLAPKPANTSKPRAISVIPALIRSSGGKYGQSGICLGHCKEGPIEEEYCVERRASACRATTPRADDFFFRPLILTKSLQKFRNSKLPILL